jgi:hypothetical protein
MACQAQVVYRDHRRVAILPLTPDEEDADKDARQHADRRASRE